MEERGGLYVMVRTTMAIIGISVVLCMGYGAGAVTQDIAISQTSDDAEEQPTGGDVSTDSSDIELVTDGDDVQTVGLRFNSIEIPSGATVTNAYIQFTCDGTSKGRCPLVIYGEDSDNAPTFVEKSTATISSRYKTDAAVNWLPPRWNSEGQAGKGQRTPDLSEIVQEIVDRGGWTAGNSMVFIITGTGSREAESFDGNVAPSLHIEWRVHDYRIEFAAKTSSGREGDDPVEFEVTLTPSHPGATISVDYKVTDISTDTDDYSPHAAGGTFTFNPGETSKSFRITVLDDDLVEHAEKFRITLSNLDAGGADAGIEGNAEHVYTIKTSDQPNDWPMWRYDANRSAATSAALPERLYRQWVLELPPLEPAWPEQWHWDDETESVPENRMTFDHGYAPVVAGTQMFVGSSVDDSLRAYDTESAREEWCYYADAPIRFAPVVWEKKVYFVSDDGWLYCLNTKDGTLVWKHRGAPTARKVLGNKRLVSMWPSRCGPVILDGTVYYASGIWPFMGVFVYALDAETGERIWINDGSGSIYTEQPHGGAVSFGALAPQGYMVAADDKLIVPNGRAVAAGLDRATGDLLYFHFQSNNRYSTAYAAAMGDYFYNSDHRYNLSDGSKEGMVADGAVLTEDAVYETVLGHKVYCMARDRMYAFDTDANAVVAVENGVQQWSETIEGKPECMLAADDKLFVVTIEGYIYCLGEVDNNAAPSGDGFPTSWPAHADDWSDEAHAIISATGEDEGYCLVLDVGTGRLMEELARYSDFNVIGIEPDAEKVRALRERWDSMNIPRERMNVIEGDLFSVELPPYMADLIVFENPDGGSTVTNGRFAEKVYYPLRPYGGTVCLPAGYETLLNSVAERLDNAEVSVSGDYALLGRMGALTGSADWTHQYADAANTVVSRDKLVKAPLGLLWFGGSSNRGILPRHRHGPTEQVVDGRLFIEGTDMMRAVDVYTGRVIWEKYLPGLGDNFVLRPITRSNQNHESGANHIGSNYATATDGVYICYGDRCLKLDPETGATQATFTIPNVPNDTYEDAVFSTIKVWDDLLVVAADPIDHPGEPGYDNQDQSCSRFLVVMDRHSGRILWWTQANHSFHHNSIIVGNGNVYCIDRIAPGEENALSRRGIKPADGDWRLPAMDARTGNEKWSSTSDIFGTWLSYSEQYDTLLQSGRRSPDMAPDEPSGRIITYNGSNGDVRWDSDILGVTVDDGPYLLHGDTIYMQRSQMNLAGALDLKTGAVRNRVHPLTGDDVPWSFTRYKGCSSAVASEYLLTFRSGSAAYYDLTTNGGITSLGGFKPGCTSNLIAANGVLNAPDYTRTCNCSYQNQTSLALIHMPEVEVWTTEAAPPADGPIERVGINFGAPGDRVTASNTLWMEYPDVTWSEAGEHKPDLDIYVEGEPVYFRHHAARYGSEGMAWVTASGAIGLKNVKIPLNNKRPEKYTVRLYFCEPEGAVPGERVFDIAIQGRTVMSGFDVAGSLPHGRQGIGRVFRGVSATDSLSVTLSPSASRPASVPTLSGIEIIRE